MTNYINMTQLRKKLGGRSRSAIYSAVKARRLPEPIKLGGVLLWDDGGLDTFLASPPPPPCEVVAEAGPDMALTECTPTWVSKSAVLISPPDDPSMSDFYSKVLEACAECTNFDRASRCMAINISSLHPAKSVFVLDAIERMKADVLHGCYGVAWGEARDTAIALLQDPSTMRGDRMAADYTVSNDIYHLIAGCIDHLTPFEEADTYIPETGKAEHDGHKVFASYEDHLASVTKRNNWLKLYQPRFDEALIDARAAYREAIKTILRTQLINSLKYS